MTPHIPHVHPASLDGTFVCVCRVGHAPRVVTPRIQRQPVQCPSLQDAAASSTSISDVAVPAVEQLIQRASQHIDGTAAIGLLHSLLHGKRQLSVPLRASWPSALWEQLQSGNGILRAAAGGQ